MMMMMTMGPSPTRHALPPSETLSLLLGGARRSARTSFLWSTRALSTAAKAPPLATSRSGVTDFLDPETDCEVYMRRANIQVPVQSPRDASS